MRKFALLIMAFFCISLNAESKKPNKYVRNYRLPVLEVVNKDLFQILDTIIFQKSKVECYKEAKILVLEFGAISNKIDLIVVDAKHVVWDTKSEQGIFYYKGYLILIRGISLDKTIFNYSEYSRSVNLADDSYIKRKDEFGNPILQCFEVIETWCTWTVRYTKNTFKILSFFSSDKKVQWFDDVESDYIQNPYILRSN